MVGVFNPSFMGYLPLSYYLIWLWVSSKLSSQLVYAWWSPSLFSLPSRNMTAQPDSQPLPSAGVHRLKYDACIVYACRVYYTFDQVRSDCAAAWEAGRFRFATQFIWSPHSQFLWRLTLPISALNIAYTKIGKWITPTRSSPIVRDEPGKPFNTISSSYPSAPSPPNMSIAMDGKSKRRLDNILITAHVHTTAWPPYAQQWLRKHAVKDSRIIKQ